ncbi:MAG: hypothetical protein OEY36_08950 [Gammaproteobacteria bacterium]|nr:hypothetical protein [Gammaproteobacteria bacterium]
MQKYLLVIVLLLPAPLMAFELFGVNINQINRVDLRLAIRDSGAEVVREAGDDNWYDVYDMTSNFKQSKFLFVAYEKTTATFAFAEYHLPYDYFRSMLLRLTLKYGKPRVRYGNFESENRHYWTVDGIKIEITQNWNKNLTRLIYTQPEKLLPLQQAYRQEELLKLSKLLNVDGSYY